LIPASGPNQRLGVELLESHPNEPLAHSSHQSRNRVRCPGWKRLDASRLPGLGVARDPEPTRKFWMYESPVDTEPSCMLLLSVGVYQRRFGGLAELAAAIRSEGDTLPPVNRFGLDDVLAKPVNGK